MTKICELYCTAAKIKHIFENMLILRQNKEKFNKLKQYI
jgi:hypothetical protein